MRQVGRFTELLEEKAADDCFEQGQLAGRVVVAALTESPLVVKTRNRIYGLPHEQQNIYGYDPYQTEGEVGEIQTTDTVEVAKTALQEALHTKVEGQGRLRLQTLATRYRSMYSKQRPRFLTEDRRRAFREGLNSSHRRLAVYDVEDADKIISASPRFLRGIFLGNDTSVSNPGLIRKDYLPRLDFLTTDGILLTTHGAERFSIDGTRRTVASPDTARLTSDPEERYPGHAPDVDIETRITWALLSA